MTSAFVIQVQSGLQSDPNEETAALLRVLIYKIDNTTFGGDVPPVPQWSGPPHTIVQVQAILYASLAASLLSAFLAMLGKQWLNRYASIDMRGSAIERSQNRQRKLDGTITWYFDHVMESLPLMLQFALLLLGCALSIYLWGIDTTVASVVLGVTSFGIIFYACIAVAGTASVSCPYQTPIARILHHILPLIPGILRSVSSSIIKNSKFIVWVVYCWDRLKGMGWWQINPLWLPLYIPATPFYLAYDIYLLTLATGKILAALTRRVYSWFSGHGLNTESASDLQCISWTLQMSLDRAIHLLALKSLATMTTLSGTDLPLVSACLDIYTSCMVVISGDVVITQGMEELMEISALCFLRIFPYLTIRDPTLNTLQDVRKRYARSFPPGINFRSFPSHHSFGTIHNILHLSQQKIQWEDHKLPSGDQITLAHALAKIAYEHTSNITQRPWGALLQKKKVPRWILRFALHHLSQDTPPPTSVITNCLLIIAASLGCTSAITPNERYDHICEIFIVLTSN